MWMEAKHIFFKFRAIYWKWFFDESNLNLKIEKVSNDDYTKLYFRVTSPIIKDTNTLESSISYSANTEDIFFDIL